MPNYPSRECVYESASWKCRKQRKVRKKKETGLSSSCGSNSSSEAKPAANVNQFIGRGAIVATGCSRNHFGDFPVSMGTELLGVFANVSLSIAVLYTKS